MTDEGVVRVIALDEEHETDPDVPTRTQAVKPTLRERPIWGIWEQVTDDGADWHYEPTEHTGLTVAEAQAHLDGLDFGDPVHVMG